MEYWEFLIQKEGDRAWLPLETPSVEILEGRYRVVARSSRPNTDVEIRLTHQSIEAGAKKQRVQKRHHRTNKDGLMVVFPFTRLQPGLWELSCVGDLMSDLLGNTWKYVLRLEVLPVDLDAEIGEEWETAASSPSPSSSEEAFSPQAIAPPPPLTLMLHQESHIAFQGQPVILSGRVELAEGANPTEEIRAYALQVCLLNPQNAMILKQVYYPLPLEPLPITFNQTLELPSSSQLRLMLGEVNLIEEEAGETAPAILATQGFTVATGVNELIETINQQRSPTNSPNVDSMADERFSWGEISEIESPRKPEVDLFFFDLVNQPKGDRNLDLPTAAKQPLPPQIYKAPLEKPLPKSPQLPLFLKPQSTPEPEPPALEAEEAEISTETPSEGEVDENLSETLEPLDIQPFDKASPDVEVAFKALRLQDRFVERLSALADRASEEMLEPEEEETVTRETGSFSLDEFDEVESPELSPTEPFDEASLELEPVEEIQTFKHPEVIIVEIDANSEAQEVVVDDEPLASPGAAQLLPLEEAHTLAENPPEAEIPLSIVNLRILPEEEPIPTPALQVPLEDLVAGELLRIDIKLPQVESRLLVKLWLQDRQTRSLLEGPRLLTDFTPDLLGNVETTTELMVPFGCMEIQIEAIAVEVSTQRESHKVTFNRMILPPDLPDLSFDEFEMS